MGESVTLLLFVLLGGWLLLLTVLFVAVVRHLGTLEATMLGVAGGTRFDFDADGPAIGSALTADAARRLADHGVDPAGDMTVLFVSTTCGSCLERATEFSQTPAADGAGLVVLAAGRGVESAAALRQVLAPATSVFIVDPDATAIVKELGIQSTPFAVRFEAGTAAAKTYVRAGDDVADLLAVPAGVK